VALAQGRLTRLAAGLASLGLLAGGCGGATTVTRTVTVTHTRTVTTTRSGGGGETTTSAPACAGGDLDGSFAVVPGSAGAGQISYELTLTNASQSACYVTGIPDVQLLDASGSRLPTHATAAQPGRALAAKVELVPGDSAYAQARFSPDVPGVGDQQGGPCEPKATALRVSPQGGGSLVVPVKPPTSVCEQGALSFELLAGSP
jgi:Domain of unknown function (DUF4232)